MIIDFQNFNKLNEQRRDDDWIDMWWLDDLPDFDFKNDYQKTYFTKEYPMTNHLLPKIPHIFNDYKDIIEETYKWFENQIKNKSSIDSFMIPSTERIKDYIIIQIGIDYKEYISDSKLEDLCDFIYESIDEYVFG